jgi:hypothetical protein
MIMNRGICTYKSLAKQFSGSNPFHAKNNRNWDPHMLNSSMFITVLVVQDRASAEGADHLTATAAPPFPPPRHRSEPTTTTPAPVGAHLSREPTTWPLLPSPTSPPRADYNWCPSAGSHLSEGPGRHGCAGASSPSPVGSSVSGAHPSGGWTPWQRCSSSPSPVRSSSISPSAAKMSSARAHRHN